MPTLEHVPLLAMVLLFVVFCLCLYALSYEREELAEKTESVNIVGFQRASISLLAFEYASPGSLQDPAFLEKATKGFEEASRRVEESPPESISAEELQRYHADVAAFRRALDAGDGSARAEEARSGAMLSAVSNAIASVDTVVRAYQTDAEGVAGYYSATFTLLLLSFLTFLVFAGWRYLLPHLRTLREETALAKEELETFYEATPTLMCIANVDGSFERVNPSVEDLLGYTPDEVEGEQFFDFIHPDDHEATAAVVERLADGDRLTQFRNRYRAKSGEYKTLEWRAVATPENGRIYAAAMDISPIETLMKGLEERTEELQRSNEALDEFAYVASHDLRGPLRDIDNLATWIEEDVADDLPPKSRVHLEKIRQRIERMDTLLTDLLAYSRVGRADSSPVEIDDMRELCQRAIDLSGAPDTMMFDVEIDTRPFKAVETRLLQVITNLVSNAVKHHDRVDGTVAVRVWTDGELVIEVSDDGPGIPEDARDRIFGLFQTLKRSESSSGMGLALVRKIVDRADGRIELESRVGEGTTFRIHWPIEPHCPEGI